MFVIAEEEVVRGGEVEGREAGVEELVPRGRGWGAFTKAEGWGKEIWEVGEVVCKNGGAIEVI